MSRFSSLSFASLGSGSKGNGTLVAIKDSCILLDCGFGLKETELRLERLAIHPDAITAILVTHEHGDHIGGVAAFARKYERPVYLTAGTLRASRIGHLPGLNIINSQDAFVLGDLHITPVAVPHDAKEPVQFVFRAGKSVLGVLTDIGCITPHVVAQYADCDALLLEANHCAAMLADGPYPPSLKERISGGWGHLSNDQTAALLQALTKPLQHLVLAHLSEQNNHPSKVDSCLAPYYAKAEKVWFACQRQGFDWLTIT